MTIKHLQFPEGVELADLTTGTFTAESAFKEAAKIALGNLVHAETTIIEPGELHCITPEQFKEAANDYFVESFEDGSGKVLVLSKEAAGRILDAGSGEVSRSREVLLPQQGNLVPITNQDRGRLMMWSIILHEPDAQKQK